MVQEERAREFCEKVANDLEESEYARSYAEKGINMSGEALEVQLNYVWGNLKKTEHKDQLREILEIDEDKGYRDGYCQVCGNRDNEAAYHSEGSEASGLVCTGCYEDFGEPDSCTDCDKITYEGDYLIMEDKEDEYYCNSCLMDI